MTFLTSRFSILSNIHPFPHLHSIVYLFLVICVIIVFVRACVPQMVVHICTPQLGYYTG